LADRWDDGESDANQRLTTVLRSRPERRPVASPPQPRRAVVVLVVLILVLLAALGGGAWYFLVPRGSSDTASSGSTSSRPNQSAAAVFEVPATVIRPSDGNTITPGAGPDGTPTAIVLSSNPSAAATGATGGAYVALNRAAMKQLAGKPVSIRISARAAQGKASDRFALAFSSGTGTSGWIVFVPTTEFQSYDMRVRIPADAGRSDSYVGIWSDVAGLGHGIEVSGLSIGIVQ